jgi:hypothetical protein
MEHLPIKDAPCFSLFRARRVIDRTNLVDITALNEVSLSLL